MVARAVLVQSNPLLTVMCAQAAVVAVLVVTQVMVAQRVELLPQQVLAAVAAAVVALLIRYTSMTPRSIFTQVRTVQVAVA
jgi:hypothetical protein